MKKIISCLIVTGLIFTGCTQDAETTGADNGLIQADIPEKILTAANVQEDGAYTFAVSNEVIEGVATYDLLSSVVINSDDSKAYTVEYATLDNADEVIDTSTLNGDVEWQNEAKEGYYTVTSQDNDDESINITISVS